MTHIDLRHFSEIMPGVVTYFQQLLEQNAKIIELLAECNEHLKDLNTEAKYICKDMG